MFTQPRIRMILLLLVSLVFLSGGCSDDDPVSVGCPGPTVDGLTPVENFTITDHPVLYATLTMNWEPPLPNPAELAVTGYEIRVDTGGASITADNWCTLPVLGTMTGNKKLGFFAKFDHEDEGIVPGATESFAVRPVYENGDLGPVGTVLVHRPTAPFSIEGLVRDDTGAPIPDMTVRLMEPADIPETFGITTSVTTGADGRFPPLGPVSDQVALIVATDSPDTLTTPEAEDSYFDFTTEPLRAGTDSEDITITLITRYVFEHQPGGWVGEHFVTWTQVMANAQYVESGYRLRKWDSYDLKVYVPEGMNNEGLIDLAAECRIAMATWNEALGLTVFTETDDPALAQVEAEYLDLTDLYGRVLMDLPAGHHFNGWVIPERALLQVDPIVNEYNAQSTFMHEFGHVLCVYNHSTNANHLMSVGGSCCLGRDELRLVHAIMNLPQNCLMSNFEKGMPWPWP